MFFEAKGGGTGRIQIHDAMGQQPDCVVPPQCARQVQFSEDGSTPAVIRAVPDSGYVLAGWEGCPKTNDAGECLVSITDYVNTEFLCAIFSWPGARPPAPGCPPSAEGQGGGGSSGDRFAPQTMIVGGPPRATRSRRAVFRFRASETARFVCRLDARPWLPCRSPKTYARLRLGWHTFRARAIDRAGNVDRTPSIRRWRVRG